MDVRAVPWSEMSATWRDVVRIEQQGLAAWADMDDPQRHMVRAVVRASLRRLLADPKWIPGSTRLDGTQLVIRVVVELDDTQAAAARAMEDLEVELAQARLEMAEALADLGGDDDGSPGTPTP